MKLTKKTIVMAMVLLSGMATFAQGGGYVKPAITPDPVIENAVKEQLKKMTLEEKIGQMVQVEINLVSYSDPEYSVPVLMKKNRGELQDIIHKFGLEKRIDINTLVDKNGQGDSMAFYPFYNLSQLINDLKPFRLDKNVLRDAFGKYKISSIQNMLGGLHAADLKTWQRSTNEIQKSALKYLGIPCMYGLDQVHGTTYTLGGTIFPQPIGMVATFNPVLAKRMGEICAYETRACGVPWVFVPDLDLGRHPAWSRQYEGMGEDGYLGATMGEAYLLGFQGNDPNHIDKYHVGSTLKHFVGYGVTGNGIDRNPGNVTDMDLREKQFAPFLRALRAGALSVMTNSSILNGMNGVANKRLLTGWLKQELNWDGVVVTDWADIENLRKRDHIVSTQKEGIVLAINAGVDMMMVPSEWGYGELLKQAVLDGEVSMARIDDAVCRVLRMKHRVGLFERPYVSPYDYPLFGCAEHVATAKQMAIESEVLLKNEDNILPIPKGKRILVCGPNANTMRGLNGGWTYSWQGSNTEKFTTNYKTIYHAICDKFGVDNVKYEPGVEYDLNGNCESELSPQIDKVVKAAANVDYILACVGENSYAETSGNIVNLHLSENQTELVRRLAGTGKPVVLILNQGRCRLIYDIEPLCKSVVDMMLPGNYGGEALADLIAGDENFSGKLPFTYPSLPQTFTTYDYKVCEVRETMAGIYNYEAKTNAQWWFGSGLSYTSFSYANMKVSRKDFTADDSIEVSVDVTNTGQRTGKEVVMLYSSDLYASLVPDNKRLRAFSKIELKPGETKKVTLKMKGSDLAFVGADGKWILEKGDFRLAVGTESTIVTAPETKHWQSPNID